MLAAATDFFLACLFVPHASRHASSRLSLYDGDTGVRGPGEGAPKSSLCHMAPLQALESLYCRHDTASKGARPQFLGRDSRSDSGRKSAAEQPPRQNPAPQPRRPSKVGSLAGSTRHGAGHAGCSSLFLSLWHPADRPFGFSPTACHCPPLPRTIYLMQPARSCGHSDKHLLFPSPEPPCRHAPARWTRRASAAVMSRATGTGRAILLGWWRCPCKLPAPRHPPAHPLSHSLTTHSRADLHTPLTRSRGGGCLWVAVGDVADDTTYVGGGGGTCFRTVPLVEEAGALAPTVCESIHRTKQPSSKRPALAATTILTLKLGIWLLRLVRFGPARPMDCHEHADMQRPSRTTRPAPPALTRR